MAYRASEKLRLPADPEKLAGQNQKEMNCPLLEGVEEAAKAGATPVIQPGGSVKDADVIGTADRLGLAMVYTGMRHFLC